MNEMIKMIGWKTYLQLKLEQHQLKFFLFWFVVLFVSTLWFW